MENIITRVEQQKRNSKRFNIYVDDKYSFSVHEDILIKFRLLKGTEIEVNHIQEVLHEGEKIKVYQKALKYLGFRSRTKNEVKEYLIKQDYEIEIINEIIYRLEGEKYIDDKQFAKAFVKQRKASNPKGKRFISAELRNKGVDEEAIEEILDSFDEEVEYELGKRVVEKNLYRYQKIDWTKARIKMIQLLQRKGFTLDTINRVIEHFKDKR